VIEMLTAPVVLPAGLILVLFVVSVLQLVLSFVALLRTVKER
jgi:hypothetical protein